MFGIASIKSFIGQRVTSVIKKMDGAIKKIVASIRTLIFLSVIVFAYLTSWQAAQLSIIPFTPLFVLAIRRVVVAAEMP